MEYKEVEERVISLMLMRLSMVMLNLDLTRFKEELLQAQETMDEGAYQQVLQLLELVQSLAKEVEIRQQLQEETDAGGRQKLLLQLEQVLQERTGVRGVEEFMVILRRPVVEGREVLSQQDHIEESGNSTDPEEDKHSSLGAFVLVALFALLLVIPPAVLLLLINSRNYPLKTIVLLLDCILFFFVVDKLYN